MLLKYAGCSCRGVCFDFAGKPCAQTFQQPWWGLVLCLLFVIGFCGCRSKAPEVIAPESLGLAFVYIQPGTFIMGSPEKEPCRGSDERQHQVTLTHGFYMQTSEVTQGQWKAIMGTNPSLFQNCGDDCPVERVSWKAAQKFIQQLNQMTGKNFRLPTEAEWEYACRAGTTTTFNTGNCLSVDKARYDGSRPLPDCPEGPPGRSPMPVKSFAPNGWGLYDMHGNIYEWCADRYGAELFADADGSVVDPAGSSSGRERVARGGSWAHYSEFARSANRSRISPGIRTSYLGFRLAFSSDKN